MATGNFVLDKGYDAAAALVKFRAVKMSAEETVTPVTAATDVTVGIAQFSVTTEEIAKGKGASVRVMGASEMEAAEAINPGQLVACDASGKAVVAAVGERVIGVCIEGAGVDTERIRLQLGLPGYILA